MKTVLITNIPAPYRIPVFNLIADKFGSDFIVIFSALSEPNRKWNCEEFKFEHVILKEKYYKRDNGAYIHNNIEIFNVLNRIKPEVVITAGFNPTCLYAWCYTKVWRKKHITFTDGWKGSEQNLTLMHKIVRKIVYRSSHAYIAAGKKSIELYKSYGVKGTRIFQSHLCIDNGRFGKKSNNSERPFDVMFSGQIIERKIPEFFTNVVKAVVARGKNINVLVIGDGPLRSSFLNSMEVPGVTCSYAGFLKQEELPNYYSKAKLLLFTTINDPWGIVANEALASGTPVITTPYAGVSDDLVIQEYNGYILDVDVELWAQQIVDILSDENGLLDLRRNAVKSVSQYTFENAARGIIRAIQAV